MSSATVFTSCSEITDDLIPSEGIIVFDWDNTLKLYDHTQRKIYSRIDKTSLQHWKYEKHCDMYIISAINPSRINLETLLMEVERLGLLELFTQKEDLVEVKSGFAKKGNIIICGYDKAEMFLKAVQNKVGKKSLDVVDSVVDAGNWNEETDGSKVVFFDDEEVNIVNFSALVKNSKCYLVK